MSIQFRSLNLQRDHVHSNAHHSNDIRYQFFEKIMDMQHERNEKIARYDNKSKSEFEQIQFARKMKEERQKTILKAYEEESRRDQQWQRYVSELFKLLSKNNEGVNNSLKQKFGDAIEVSFQEMEKTDVSSDQRNELLVMFETALLSEAGSRPLESLITYQTLQAMQNIQQQLSLTPKGSKLTNIIQECKSLESEISKLLSTANTPQASGSSTRKAPPLYKQATFQDQIVKILSSPYVYLIPPDRINELKRYKQSDSPKLTSAERSFACIAQAAASVEWLETLVDGRMSGNSVVYSQIDEIVRLMTDPKQVLYSSSVSGKLSVRQICKALNSINAFIKQVQRDGGAVSTQNMLKEITNCVLNIVREKKDFDTPLFYALVLCIIGKGLNVATRKQFVSILSAVFSSHELLVPNFMKSSSSYKISYEDQLALVPLLAGLVSYQGLAPLVSVAQAWKWIFNACQQFNTISYYLSSASATSNSEASNIAKSLLRLPEACNVLNAFISRASNVLLQHYQERYVSLLKSIVETIDKLPQDKREESHTSNLRTQASDIISMQHSKLVVYNAQESFVVAGELLISSIETVEEEIITYDADKTTPFMQKVKSLQIDRMRAIFNRTGATAESQRAAAQQLIDLIVLSNKDSPELLRYTLHKAVGNILKDCQEDFFSYMDKAQPSRLANLSCIICAQISQIRDVLRGLFYSKCPLLLPKIIFEGTEGETFTSSLGFLPQENKDKWLDRMSKIICVFSLICLQPEQTPFSFEDLWTWLVRLTNSCAFLPSEATKKLFFLSNIFEIVLRVAGKELLAQYRGRFMELLKIIHDSVLPKLETRNPNPLKVFLERFISSNGNDFLELFTS